MVRLWSWFRSHSREAQLGAIFLLIGALLTGGFTIWAAYIQREPDRADAGVATPSGSPSPTGYSPTPDTTDASPSASATATDDLGTSESPSDFTYLSDLKNLTGRSVNSPKGLYIGKVYFANSLEIACINWDGGGHAKYDVSPYSSLKGTLGLPSDHQDMEGATCAVTLTDETGKKLKPTYRFSAGSPAVDVDLSLDNVTQLHIQCVLEYPRNKGMKHVYVAFGDALLS